MSQSQSIADSIERAFNLLKEGDVFEPTGDSCRVVRGKQYTKLAGLLVAPDMEAYNWMKANAHPNFFDNYVVRILIPSSARFSST
jgi:hypothetical protein